MCIRDRKQIEPKKSIVLLEKEDVIAAHQTGNNSGVIHSGIYYKPGSLKAINCRKGKLALEKFCKEHGVNYESCGKVIVATSKEEIPAMNKIYDRGNETGVSCKIINDKELKDLKLVNTS